MIFRAPALDGSDEAVLALIFDQKERLKLYANNSPGRWFGSLRRSTLARAIQGSNSIEGYTASLDDAIAAVEDEPVVLDERTEVWKATIGYRDALTYICQAAQDPYFEFSKQFLKSLHFMMLGFDMSKYPGQWRRGSIFVVNAKNGETVYTGPDVELVNTLIDELVIYLKEVSAQQPIIRAAMAHLNLTMIHPFKDGNGRMARALQTLVIALGGTLHPVFSSIEEWLGQNTDEYYQILAEVGHGSWNPQSSTLPWIRFCLKAHYQQAATLIRRNDEYDRLFGKISEIIQRERLPERAALPLFDAALGFRLTNSRYRTDAEVTEAIASRDLKKLCDLGLLNAQGEKRGRTYRGADELRLVRLQTRRPVPRNNPYTIVLTAQKMNDQGDGTPFLPGF